MVTHLFRVVRLPPMQVLEEAGDREDIGPGIHEDEDNDDMRTTEDRRGPRRGEERMVMHLFRAVRLPPMQVLEEAGDREDIGPGIHEDEDNDDMRTT